MLVTKENIISLIPQGKPFIMIDELLFNNETFTRTALHITIQNIFVENGELKEPGIVENIAQTAAARSGYLANYQSEEVPVGYIGAIKNLQVFALPKVGETIETEIEVANQIFNISVIKGKVMCNEKLLAECEMKIFLTPLNKPNHEKNN